MQLNKGYKGFSFSQDGPLDMRMGPDTDLTAKEVVNQFSEQKLGEIFREFGEEPAWKKAAKAIVSARRQKPIETTQELSALLTSALGFKKRGKLHPATLIFQALRIVVNQELQSIEIGLTKALEFLAKGGRLGAMSFHSLEDRIVKNIFRTACRSSKKEKAPLFSLLTKKPITPSYEEIRKNRRSRSAKMRFIQKNFDEGEMNL